MRILEFLAEKHARKLFPDSKKEFWYCYEFYEYQRYLRAQSKPYRSEEIELPCGTLLLNPYRNYSQIREGAILPLMKVGDWTGFYEITRRWMYASPGSDFASWDDGHYVNLKLHHCEKAEGVKA